MALQFAGRPTGGDDEPRSADVDVAAKSPLAEFRALCRNRMADADGDPDRGATLVKRALKKDRALFNRIARAMVDAAIYVECRAAMRGDRRLILHRAPNEPRVETGGFTRASLAEVRSLLDYRLSDGKKLGDATRPDLQREKEMHAVSESAHAWKKRWFALLERALPDDSTPVRDKLDDSVLRELQRKAGERQ